MSITQNIENFSTQTALAAVCPYVCYDLMYVFLAGSTIFVVENPLDSPKNWTLWSFLYFSSLWSILFETFFGACSYAVSHSRSLHTCIWEDTEKGPFRSNYRFSVSSHMYVMILNGKLHMSKLQKLVSNRIFQERKVLHICLFKILPFFKFVPHGFLWSLIFEILLVHNWYLNLQLDRNINSPPIAHFIFSNVVLGN